MRKTLTTTLVLALTYGVAIAADPPAILNHQGRIAVSGTNYDGTGHFKFSFVDAAGTTTYWSNDGTGSAGGEPTSAVSVVVNAGHYAVRLGDTSLANMTAVPVSTFTDHADVHLRIWFGQAPGGPFELLSPDRRVTSTGYALSASQAQTVADNAITEGKLADGAVTSSKLAADSVTTTNLAPGSVDNTILAEGAAGENIDAQGSMGIGLDGIAPEAGIDLDSTKGFVEPLLLAELKDGVGGFNELLTASSVFVSNDIAYITSNSDDSLTIANVSTPSAPVLLAELKDGVGGFNELDGSGSVFVSNDIAYVASNRDDSLTIIDVSTPSSPTLLAELKDGVGGFDDLNGASSVFVSNDIAYVAAFSDAALAIINVSTPATPSLLGVAKNGVGGFNELNGPTEVHVSNGVAYVTSQNADSLTIIDVSTPSSPALLAEIKDGVGGFNELNAPQSVFVSNNIAYVASSADHSLTLIDVSTPSSPMLLAELKDGVGGFTQLNGAISVFVSDDTAYVASGGNDSLTIIDVSTPSTPGLLAEIRDGVDGFNELNRANSVFVADDTAYVASFDDDSLTIIDVTKTRVDLATTNRVGIGTTRPDAMLHVEGDAVVTGSLLDSAFQSGTSGQILSTTGAATSWIDLLDNDPTNEIQDLSLTSDTLSISGGGTSADLGQYFLGDGSENFSGQLNVVGGKVRIDNEQSYAARDSSGTLREMLKKTSNDETSIATAQSENIIFRDGSNTNMTMTGDNGYFGIGDLDPLARLHVKNSDTGYSVSDSADIYVEDTDASIFLLSSEQALTGSSVSLAEVDSRTGDFTDRWTLSRQTTGGTGDSSLNLIYNDGSPTTAASFSTKGDLTVNGDVKLASAKTRKLQLPAAAFSGDSLESIRFGGDGYITTDTDPILVLFAPVYLPQDSTVTSLNIYYYDNSASGAIVGTQGFFLRRPANSPNFETLAETPPAASGGASALMRTMSDDTITDPVITDGAAYHVTVVFFVDSAGDTDLRFYGAEIEYTYENITP